MIDNDYKMTAEELHLQQVIENANVRYNENPDIVCIDRHEPGRIIVMFQNMYEFANCTFGTLCAVGEFFGTDRVNVIDESRNVWGGCDTCDYGSQYYFELEVLID